MHLINQPLNETLGSFIISNLNSDYNKFSFIVAYTKFSGVRHLLDSINTFKSNGGQVVGIIGIDQYNTSIEAIQTLFNICDELYIYHSENSNQTFHPKVYCFESIDSIWISIGSSNMTSGGLFTNYETNIYHEIDSTNSDFYNISSDIHRLFDSYSNTENNCCLRVTENIIISLINNRYIYSEQQIARTRTTATNSNNFRNNLFGSETFSIPSQPVLPSNVRSSLNNLTEEFNSTSNINETNEIYLNYIKNYNSVYGSYFNFIELIDGFAKNYYYIPQGVHLGHIFYIIKSIGDGTPLDYRLTLFNSSTSGADGTTTRQTNYKIGACMELLLLNDYRLPTNISNNSFSLQLTSNGQILYEILNNNVTDSDFYNFSTNSDTTWRMVHNNSDFYVAFIQGLTREAKETLYQIFSNLTIFRLLVDFISNHPNNTIAISELYNEFWEYPTVVDYLNLIDISVPSQTSLEHRIPFLISLLRSFSIADYDSTNSENIIRI
ncbi:hypothetical protein [Clostridium paraputrificum]|uniref:hypothetical protein n=1 Tax=Clostridium paraputrificum TaxID=29363 RepID=UPI0034A494C3